MSIQKQFRRDTAANLAAVLPADGEPAYNTTDDRLHVGNGSTNGGIPHLNYFDDIKSYFHYNTTAGSANAYTLDLPFNAASYTAGMRIRFKASFSNTGSATINVDGLGAKTLKKLSSGALTALSSGDIISGRIYEAVYDGTDFQLFGFEMAGTLPGMVLLSTATASASSSLNFTSLISSTYNSYKFILSDIRPATDDVELWLRTSTDNGSTYDSSANNYEWVQNNFTIGATPADAFEGSDTDTKIRLVNDSNKIGNNAAYTVCGEVNLYNPLGTVASKLIHARLRYRNNGGVGLISETWGHRDATSDIDAIRFLMSSGNITSGNIKMYGLRA